MKSPALRRRVPTVVALLLGAACLTPGAATGGTPAPEGIVAADPAPVLAAPAPVLAESQRGRRAVRRLGDRLGPVAERHDLRPAELRSLLRTDETAWVDPDGGIYFVDPAPTAGSGPTVAVEASPVAPLADTFRLHSNPGSRLKILLDFDGATVSGTQWNLREGVHDGEHPAWDPAGDGPGFGDAERLLVQQVWAIVAEDYAPFDVDVTTEDPGAALVRDAPADTEYGIRVLVSPSQDAHARICQSSCGGVAYLNVFGRVGSSAQPAWVFPQALRDDPKSVAEAATHEAGHNLSLQHDGGSSSYYLGHGSWAPVMGAGYRRPLVQWSAGAYPGADNHEDDVAALTDRLGTRPDEAPGSVDAPSALPSGEALIATRDDVDAYLLGSCEAGSPVQVLASAVAPNLDVRATLHDAGGVQRAVSAPASGPGDGVRASGVDAALTVPEAGGGWVLTVEGAGQGGWSSQGYDDYGSLGAYTVEAPGCLGNVPDGVPGAPRSVTASATPGSLTLTWSPPASEGAGAVTGYVVSRSGSSETPTLPASARSHTFTGLLPGTTHHLTVRAVNARGAGATATVVATTAEQPPAAPGAPRDVTATYLPDASTTRVGWAEPLEAGSQPIAGYAVSLDGELLGIVDPSRRDVELVGALAPGTHVVGVAARSAAGSSPVVTVAVEVRRPDPGPTPGPTTGPTTGPGPSSSPTPSATPPPKVRGLKVRTRGSKVVVTWRRGTTGPVTRYLLDLSRGKDRKVGGSARKLVLPRPKAKRGRVKVRVAARNAAGTSPWSRWVRVRPR